MLDSFASRLLLRQGEYDDAVAAARSGVVSRPNDPLAHVWLGQTLVLASGRPQDDASRKQLLREAGSSFARAVDLAPEDHRSWSGLLWYGVRTGDKLESARALDGLRSKAKLTEPQRLLALGQAHQLLGEHGRAEEHFTRAAQLLPRDPAVQASMAQFYLSYAPEKAVQAFRRLLELAPDSKAARRTLATLLVTQGTDAQFSEAIKLLSDAGDESTDRRLQAVLLIQRGGKDNLRDARDLLNAVVRGTGNPNPTDRHLLAIVAEADGDLATAQQQLVHLATDTKGASYLCALIEFLIRHDQHQEVAGYLQRLTELEPNSVRTVQLQLKWLKATGSSMSTIKNAIEQFEIANRSSIGEETQRLHLLNVVVGLYSQVGLHSEAESRFRNFLRESPSNRAEQAFALWLVRSNRFSEAVRFALDGFKAEKNEAGFQLLSNILAIAASRGQRFADAESQVDQFVHSNPDNAQLLFELATLKHMLGDGDVAVKLYEQSIQLAPGNAFAHNNLAMLLLDRRGATSDSRFHIEEALRIAGPNPELRDTYAIILAQQGHVDEASRILKSLLSRFPRNPRYQFHLAFAYEKSGNLTAAAEALAKAQSYDLDAETLTPQEQRMLNDLRRRFARESTAEKS
jgi:tetratricopeptide (TPR) repeat protein